MFLPQTSFLPSVSKRVPQTVSAHFVVMQLHTSVVDFSRFVADVPCAGRRVQLVLRVRKFRCDTASCPRKIFAERLGPFIEAWARKTTRLREEIEAIGLSTCGEVGARLASRLAIATSPTTILRRIMGLPLPVVGTV